MPDRHSAVAQDQDVSSRASTLTQVQSPTEALFARTDARFDAEFTTLFGSGGPEARVALESAAAAEGPAAYDRFRSSPDEFGAVVGDRTRADMIGGALEALSYSKAVHAAEQEGQTPSVPGYSGVPVEAPDLTIGLQDGIYLDGEGNQVGGLGSGSTRLFVVTDREEARAMRAAWDGGAGTEPLRGQIGSALEIPSLDALRAIHADIMSHDWQTHEVSRLWGLDQGGRSMVSPGGIGPVIQRWDPISSKAHASPYAARDAGSPLPNRALGLAGYSLQGTYHSHPDRAGRNIVSSIERTDTDPGGDRQQALRDDRDVPLDGHGSGRSVNVLMNPGRNGQTVIYTSSGDVLSVPTEALVRWRSVNSILVK